jgi:ADP-heptose:LPS heptosyltransferase
MRAIDHWVGVPLCFVLTVIRRLFGRGACPRRPVRRVLFIELSEMGSTILADPAMRKTRAVLGAELFFVIFRRNAASLKFLDTVPAANIYTIREDSLVALAVDTLGLLLWTRRRGIDSVIDLELFSRFTALLCGLVGADHRVGFHGFHNEGLYRGALITHRVAYNPHIHIAKNFIALVNALASPAPEIPYSKTAIGDDEIQVAQVSVGETAKADLRRRVGEAVPGFADGTRRLVLINSNASEMLPQRRWPAEHFAELARLILARWPDVVVLLTGSPDEEESAARLAAQVDDARLASIAGRLALSDLPALYSVARLMITNDSGPGHFASVTGMATIVLFGPETPALYRPLGNTVALTAGLACSPCVSATNHRKTACTEPVCMRVLSPLTVFQAVVDALG